MPYRAQIDIIDGSPSPVLQVDSGKWSLAEAKVKEFVGQWRKEGNRATKVYKTLAQYTLKRGKSGKTVAGWVDIKWETGVE